MKFKKYILLTALLAFASFGCQDFDELELNPNQPTSAPPSLILNGILNDLADSPWSEVQRWNQFWCINYNYYGNNEYNWTTANFSFFTLKNVQKMEEEALRSGAAEVNPYSALGKFLHAYFLVRMTLLFGDIPMTEALQGIANPAPVYDTQKAVFAESLNLLEQANDDLAQLISSGNRTLEGDIFLGNDLSAWRKVVNAYKLRVLIHLSAKADDADLKVKQRFAEMLGNPTKYPLMDGMQDNMEYQFNSAVNLYPLNPGNQGFHSGRYNMSATYLNTLVSLRDPRTFIVADPAAKKIKDGLSPTDFAAYVGASSGESLDDMTFKAGNGEYSFINQKRYYGTFTGPETSIQIGYPEQCFNIAEGINRGWATGDAAAYYSKGITASMSFYGITDAAALDVYLKQPEVAYAGGAKGLEQILLQKYLAFYQHSGWEAFFNQRRTGVPEFLVGVGTGNSSRIPKRFQYPESERTTNAQHYQEALTRQFGNTDDDINDKMWLIK